MYRLLEGISYTIPLIFVSKNKNYKKSYKSLKSFFGKQDDGELAFFKRFITQTYSDEDFFKSTIDIDLNSIELEELREEYYNIYIQKIAADDDIKDKTEGEEIKISFIGFYKFLINIRNRFFHFTQGTWQDNLSTNEITYTNIFFKPLIHPGLNWISIILFEIIKADFDKEK